MKKKLNEASIVNELRGESAYFPGAPAAEAEGVVEVKPRKRAPRTAQPQDPEDGATVGSVPEQPAVTEPSTKTPEADTGDASPPEQQVIEGIRKAVKRLGKEAAFCRFTPEEKNALADVIYTYKRGGVRTSENEVIRIAVNWLLENYRNEGKNSVLATVLEKLHA